MTDQLTLRTHPAYPGLTRRQLAWVGQQVSALHKSLCLSRGALHETDLIPVLRFCTAYYDGIIDTDMCLAAILHLGETESGVRELAAYVTDTRIGLAHDAYRICDALPVSLRHPITGEDDIPAES